MAKKRKLGPKRRRKTPGVSILSPQPVSRIPWRIAYIDPDEPEKGRQRRLIPLEWRGTPELRQEYAARKAERIEERKRELARGATPKTGTAIAEARRQWLETTLHAGTRKMHRNGTTAFEAWTTEHGVLVFDDLRKGHLAAFRDHLPSVGVGASTRNRWLINTGAFLKWAIGHEYVPFVSPEHIKQTFTRWPTSKEEIVPYTPRELRKIFEAAERHDRDLLAPQTGPGRKRKPIPITPLITLVTLSGMRREEAVELRREDFDPNAQVQGRRVVGAIKVRSEIAKGGEARTIKLDYSPALAGYLRALQLATTKGERLCGIIYSQAGVAMDRLQNAYGVPFFTWQRLRQTASCFLTSAPNIFGSAAHIQSARRLGHSLKVADQYYLEAVEGLDEHARTLEAAMGVTDTLTRVCAGGIEASTSLRPGASTRTA